MVAFVMLIAFFPRQSHGVCSYSSIEEINWILVYQFQKKYLDIHQLYTMQQYHTLVFKPSDFTVPGANNEEVIT